jgi:hypothetical protein
MLDLETVGTSAGWGYLYGACTFDRTQKFYERISPASSSLPQEDIETSVGGTSKILSQKQKPLVALAVCLNKFHDWFRKLNGGDYKHTFIWGNGADFDLPILAGAYQAVDRPVPWHPWNGRCYRTLKNLLPAVAAPPRASKKHHALDDAIYQAMLLLLQVL